MRWFKHLTSTHRDEEISALISECGLEAYGFYWMLWEVVGESMDKTGKCSLTHTLPQWSRLLYSHHHRVGKYLGKLGVRGIVTVEYVEGSIRVTIPNLLKLRDEYSKKSGQRKESVRTIDTDTEYRNKTPLSPQGGEAGPRREGDSGKVVSVTAAQGEVQAKASAVAAEIHARHPKARRDIGAGGVTKALLAILNLEGGTKAAKLARLDEINRNHEGWCKADQWAKDGGVFAKSLENWLAPTKGRYAVPPIRDQDDDDFARRHRMFLATDAPFSVGNFG